MENFRACDFCLMRIETLNNFPKTIFDRSILMKLHTRIFFIAFVIIGFPQKLLAWGERGHDVVSRVAARLSIASNADNSFTKLLVRKENMLGHLSNVPDIVWRNGDKSVIAENSTTHYIDLDYLADKPDLNNLPKGFADAKELAKKRGKDLVKDVGTATWRACQLHAEMTSALAAIKGNQIERAEMTRHVNRALMMAGLMAHFVGDLAQPLHAHSDYDGWVREQGGLHSYFESDLVDAMALNLDDRVFAAGSFQEILRRFASKSSGAEACQTMIWTLAVDSFNQVAALFDLDAKNAIIGKSKTEPLKLPAKRAEPEKVLGKFEEFIVSRMATGSYVLSELWLHAWKQAGKPDLSAYQSWDYPVAPEFIKPSYIH